MLRELFESLTQHRQVHEDATARIMLFVGAPDGRAVPAPLPVTRMLELVTYADESAGNQQRAKVLKELSAAPRKNPPLRVAGAGWASRQGDGGEQRGANKQVRDEEERQEKKKKKKSKEKKEKKHKEKKGGKDDAQRSKKAKHV